MPVWPFSGLPIGFAVDHGHDVVDLVAGACAKFAALGVRASDKASIVGGRMSGQQTRGIEAWLAERDAVASALAANRERRAQAEAELQAARDELRDLLVRGQAVALEVAGMARTSGVSRDTAHRLLRQAGSLSYRQRHRLKEAR